MHTADPHSVAGWPRGAAQAARPATDRLPVMIGKASGISSSACWRRRLGNLWWRMSLKVVRQTRRR